MTVFGGKETVWGTKIGGFFVTCTKCGWHSKVKMYIAGPYYDVAYIHIECGHCGNTVEVKDD